MLRAIVLLTSLLTILIFPNFNLSALAWVALVPLLLYLLSDPKHPFWTAWFSGTMAYAGILYWIVVTFQAARQSLWLAVPCYLLLSAYLGFFWGLWGLYAARLPRNRFFPLAAAAGWAALEYLRTFLFSGFPWALLGDSQIHHLAVIQISAITGVYGVSFLIVLANAAFALFIVDRARPYAPLAMLIAYALLAANYGLGTRSLRAADTSRGAPLRVALLQGSIDQYRKWDKAYAEAIQTAYAGLIHQATAAHPDLIVWPETSVPGYLLQDPPLRAWLDRVIAPTGADHLVGAPSLFENSSLNAAYLMNARGDVLGRYAKHHLVPFGEIVPFGSLLGRWIHALNDLGGFTAGTDADVITSARYTIGANICYEAIFPDLVRRSVKSGADFIVNLTNDGWYMRTAAPYQHFAPNVFRAVENRRWLIRADNTGISAIIDPAGHVVAASGIFQPAVVAGEIHRGGSLTFYTRYGDVFAWLSATASMAALIL